MVASPQIRNAGTLGGNVCQDTRCWYYRYGMPCYRAGGNICYAGTPEGMNREHALFGADRCVAVTPSDSAPALVALDAEMVVRNAGGERVIPAGEFFMPPGVDITRMTVLDPDDLLTAVRIPAGWAGARFYFEKVSDRKTWDFPLVNVAAALKVADGRDRGLTHRLRRGRMRPAPPHRRGGPDSRPRAEREHGRRGGRTRHARRQASQLQPLQDPAGEKPGRARGAERLSDYGRKRTHLVMRRCDTSAP